MYIFFILYLFIYYLDYPETPSQHLQTDENILNAFRRADPVFRTERPDNNSHFGHLTTSQDGWWGSGLV